MGIKKIFASLGFVFIYVFDSLYQSDVTQIEICSKQL